MAYTEVIKLAAEEGVIEGPFSKSSFLRRRRFIVDSKLQFGLIGSFFLLLATFLLILTATIFGPPIADLLNNADGGESLLKSSRQLMALDARYWPALGLSAVIVMAAAVRITHRLAGPLYRFKCIFNELGGEVVPRNFKLRGGDYLTKEADLLNLAIDRMRTKEVSLNTMRSELNSLQEELDQSGEQKGSQALRRILKDFDQAVSKKLI